MDPYIARQPIFKTNGDVYGYELLFRSGSENYFDQSVDGETATSKLICDTMGIHGLEELTSGSMVFVNVTEKILVNSGYSILPPEQTVIELLETVEMNDAVHNACREVRKNGYLLALDDYIGDPSFDRILGEIDILKIDFRDTTPEMRREISHNLEGKRLKVLAEKVETHDEFREAVELGYSYMQGYFFSKPEMIKGASLPGFKLNYLQFLQEINQPDLNLDELEQIIIRDVSLTFQLLKMLNSAAVGVRHEVTSVKHAMVLLGDVQLRKWASLIALSGLGSDKPSELLVTSLVRGKFCELLGRASGRSKNTLNLFLLGLFSVLDALVDKPMEEALALLPLNLDVVSTLAGGETELSSVYELVLAFERGDWKRVEQLDREIDLDDGLVAGMHHDAIVWAHSVMGSQQGARVKKAS